MSDKPTLKEILQDIDARIAHIEDINADNREVIIKLVKQNNQIVEFLKGIDIEIEKEIGSSVPNIPESKKNINKFVHIKDLIDEYMDKHKDLQELEKELKKHKCDITPGQIGEA